MSINSYETTYSKIKLRIIFTIIISLCFTIGSYYFVNKYWNLVLVFCFYMLIYNLLLMHQLYSMNNNKERIMIFKDINTQIKIKLRALDGWSLSYVVGDQKNRITLCKTRKLNNAVYVAFQTEYPLFFLWDGGNKEALTLN